MTLYKNSRIQNEMDEDDNLEADQKLLNEAESQKGVKSDDGHDWADRYANLMRLHQSEKTKNKEEIETLKRQMQKIASGEIRPPKSEAEIIAWEKEYPDFAQIMDARVERIVEGKIQPYKTQANKLKVSEAKNDLRSRHPDLDDLVKPNSDFMKWLAKQPQKHIKAMTESLDVDDADFVIDKYKTQVLSKKKHRDDDDFNDNTNTARTVRTKSSAPVINDDDGEYLYSESQIQKMNAREWDAHGDKVQKALREGKVLMDISGGAR